MRLVEKASELRIVEHLLNPAEIEGRIAFPDFIEDIVAADSRVLDIRSRFAVEIQRFLEIERDDRRACELQQEVPQGPDSNLVSDGLGFCWCQRGVPFD